MQTVKPSTERGAALLLAHCSAVPGGRPSAFTRLEREVGEELARLLVFALTGPQGRRGSSAP
jgi:hypothetical protein